jgi:hypothetical protein
VIERFTPSDDDTILLEVLVEDPAMFAQPWRLSMPLSRDQGYRIYEYACHEGNHAVPNILSGARAADRAK